MPCERHTAQREHKLEKEGVPSIKLVICWVGFFSFFKIVDALALLFFCIVCGVGIGSKYSGNSINVWATSELRISPIFLLVDIIQ